jgi:hypothetical protein
LPFHSKSISSCRPVEPSPERPAPLLKYTAVMTPGITLALFTCMHGIDAPCGILV